MTSIKQKIYNIIHATIQEYNLIKKNDKIIIGISGGPDSVSLLLVLNKLKNVYNLKLLLAHVNHMLRGKDSDKDEEFVRNLANEYKIPARIKKVNIPVEKKKQKKLSIEEIGHIERTRFFQFLLKKEKFDKIALGHNLDDRIEHFLLKSLDGGSLSSLSGIKPCENSIIRPLIKCYKKDLALFIQEHDIPFRTDHSNLNNAFPRNWIRNKLIPYIEKNYKPIKNNLSNLINILHYENDFTEHYYHQITAANLTYSSSFYTAQLRLNRLIYKFLAIQRRLIRDILINLKITYNFKIIDRISQFLSEQDQTSIQISNLYIWKYQDQCFFSLKKYMKKNTIYINQKNSDIKIENINIRAKINRVEKKSLKPGEKKKKNILLFDQDKINQIIIRQKKIGDYIILMNTNFRTRLKKLFIDLKIPNPLKQVIPIIEAGNEIIGIYFNIYPVFITNRISDRYKITEKTKNIIRMEFLPWHL